LYCIEQPSGAEPLPPEEEIPELKKGGDTGIRNLGVVKTMPTVMQSPDECIGDINGDEFVNTADLLILLGSWGS
jgi:hypothetical protein